MAIGTLPGMPDMKVMATLRLPYEPPLAWTAFSQFLAGRSAQSVERMSQGAYWRTVRCGDATGWIRVEPSPDRAWLRVRHSPSLEPHAEALLPRLRIAFDLQAQPLVIDAHLGRDASLRALVRRTPGLRVPGTFDGFELAVRAVLGQRISVRVATILAGKLAERFGEEVETPLPELRRAFPSAETLADLRAPQLRAIGLGGPPVEAILALARGVADGTLVLDPGPRAQETLERLPELPGIGPWTAQYIGMRALRLPDAFPHSDLGLCKALSLTPAKMLARADAWRPWRAYAALHLWNSLSATA
jgi:AraC family transcriptional regulator of adaptative response / DNA-3-methyladenine glycosylase II